MAALLTCQDVADRLRPPITAEWVRAEARAGRIDHRKVGRHYRFTEEDVDAFIERVRRVARDPYARSARVVVDKRRTGRTAA